MFHCFVPFTMKLNRNNIRNCTFINAFILLLFKKVGYHTGLHFKQPVLTVRTFVG
uniref:Uncharacterized protein n=1 Tax=Anguilla anguilla TaxID=7936 RepID=A0A0E9U7L0_ANGAN